MGLGCENGWVRVGVEQAGAVENPRRRPRGTDCDKSGINSNLWGNIFLAFKFSTEHWLEAPESISVPSNHKCSSKSGQVATRSSPRILRSSNQGRQRRSKWADYTRQLPLSILPDLDIPSGGCGVFFKQYNLKGILTSFFFLKKSTAFSKLFKIRCTESY